VTNSPTEILMQEHRVIERVIKVIYVILQKLEEGQPVNRRTLMFIFDFMHNYADQYHHAKEEKDLFLALLARGVSVPGCRIRDLIREHEAGRKCLKELSKGIEIYDGKSYDAKKRIIKNLRILAGFYPNHIWKENHLLFPAADKVLSREEQKQIYIKFENAEITTADVHSRYELFARKLEKENKA
jgi:hemerythrin-like domain-containing protein